MQYFFKNAADIECREEEAARYMGVDNGYWKKEHSTLEIRELLRRAINDVRVASSPRAVWDVFPLSLETKRCTLSFADVAITSNDLMRFATCHGASERIVLFASTLGSSVDAVIRRAQTADRAVALALQATGAAMIEAFVDELCLDICRTLVIPPTTRRYSPGYGDVPLDVERIFFRLLDTSKIALSLMDTLVMTPEKSVTAFLAV